MISKSLGMAPSDDTDADIGGARYLGGDGNDIFDLTLHLGAYDDASAPGDAPQLLHLGDFTHGEDQLLVEV